VEPELQDCLSGKLTNFEGQVQALQEKLQLTLCLGQRPEEPIIRKVMVSGLNVLMVLIDRSLPLRWSK
jgi:hypothetical protein